MISWLIQGPNREGANKSGTERAQMAANLIKNKDREVNIAGAAYYSAA